MFKRTVNYTNFNGDPKTADLYFHLSKTDLTEIVVDGTKDRMDAAVASQNKLELMRELRNFVGRAIGARSDDGESFDKSPETVKKLTGSAAYDQLLSELMIDENVVMEFVMNLVPPELRKDLAKQLDDAMAQKQLDPMREPTTINHGRGIVELEADSKAPEWLQQRRLPTKHEMKGIKPNELKLLFKLRAELASEQRDQPAWLKEKRFPTDVEYAAMSFEEATAVAKAIQDGIIEP